MNAKIIAATKFGYVPTKKECDKLAGLTAGVCYLPDTTEKLFAESDEKTERRTNIIKASGHHSPFDHISFTLDFENLPKILAMFLNNEKAYTTSEKSARYKRMPLPEDEQKFYDKWLEIFKKRIAQRYQTQFPERFTDVKITKLAQENARYLTSVFTPTAMEYTVSYRQLNVLYGMIKEEIGFLQNKTDIFSQELCKNFEDLKKIFEETGYIDTDLSDNRKNRHFCLFQREPRKIIKQFGEVYCVAYEGSFAELAQAQRHRSLSYTCSLPQEELYYVPAILNAQEKAEWLQDCKILGKNKVLQGRLLNIVEKGEFDAFILKAKERNCSDAQLEIDKQTTATKLEMYESLKEQNHPLAKSLEPYTHGSRCTFPDFKCPCPCGFADGIKGTREI